MSVEAIHVDITLVGDPQEGIDCKHLFIEEPLEVDTAEMVAAAIHGRFIENTVDGTHIAVDGAVMARRRELEQNLAVTATELGLSVVLSELEVSWKEFRAARSRQRWVQCE